MSNRPFNLVNAALTGFIFVSATPAIAEDMSSDQLRKFLVGRTYFLEVTAGGTLAHAGQATLFFAPSGVVLNRIPSGKIQQGTWTIKDNTVCVEWKDLPPNPCSRYDKRGDVVTVVNIATGRPRGRIVKSVDGNAENLTP
ncbi:MAG TPA: hypothetical protein VN655_18005 [Pseudolabrys sp.]|jgi:hypothetical protein|nr:hypothetical protein [Pseudolabrys sp.]